MFEAKDLAFTGEVKAKDFTFKAKLNDILLVETNVLIFPVTTL